MTPMWSHTLSAADGRVGDWIAEDTVGGRTRRGLILEVLGTPDRPHYRVRWDEEHEALHFPGAGSRIERHER